MLLLMVSSIWNSGVSVRSYDLKGLRSVWPVTSHPSYHYSYPSFLPPGASPFPTNAASAFHVPISSRHLEQEAQESPTLPIGIRNVGLESKKLPLSNGYESETDDEEVKLNCIGGVQPYMTSDDEDDFEDDDQSCCSDDSEAEM